MSYCIYCGGAIQRGADVRFCPHCGKPADYPGSGAAKDDLESQLLALLKAGKGLDAVKRHREATKASLRGSMDAVNVLAASNGLPPATGKPGQSVWLIRLLGSAFAGLMIATAGVAVFPDLGIIAKPFLCESLAVVSRQYSYKPGQWGVTRTFYCGREVVTWKVMFFTFLIYTAIFFGVWTLWKFVRRLIS
ncbi:MAG TPA: hypothetical protein VFX30_08840 [bacterium]|nr:hypothetical protein [bacterium]